MADDIPGIDDVLAKQGLARRLLLSQLVDEPLLACGRRFTHPHRLADIDALSPATETCGCLRPRGHAHVCLCEHGMQRVVYRVDDDGREHYATLPLR
jgi:hypothetical protein